MDESEVAYHGNVLPQSLVYAVGAGRKLKLRLVVEDDYRAFTAFTKPRKGRAGTRHRLFLRHGDKPFASGEAMFLGWSVSNTAGAVVAFEIDEGLFAALEPAWGDGPLELVLNEIDTDEKVVNQEQKAAIAEVLKGGPLSKNAARTCDDPDFHAFVAQRTGWNLEESRNRAAEYVRSHCRIDSRAKLDHNAAAAGLYQELHREFIHWCVDGA